MILFEMRSPRNNALADAIRETRTRLGETQTKFAERIDVSISAIAHYEIGSQRPKPSVLKRLIDLAAQEGFTKCELVFRAAADRRMNEGRSERSKKSSPVASDLEQILSNPGPKALEALRLLLANNPSSRIIGDAIRKTEREIRERTETLKMLERLKSMMSETEKRTDTKLKSED